MPAPSEQTAIDTEPWFMLPIPTRERWHNTGNPSNVPGYLEDDIVMGKDIPALVVLQDCNIGGQYYRYFWWIKGDSSHSRYCDVRSGWKLGTPNEGVTELRGGQVVTVCDQYKFRVSTINCTDYYKILERVYE